MRVKQYGKEFGYWTYGASDAERFSYMLAQSGPSKDAGYGLWNVPNGSYIYIGLSPNLITSGYDSWIIPWCVFEDGTMIEMSDPDHMWQKPSLGENNRYKSIKGENEDGTGRWGRNGVGEPLTIDGIAYTARFMGFGSYGDGRNDPTQPDTIYHTNQDDLWYYFEKDGDVPYSPNWSGKLYSSRDDVDYTISVDENFDQYSDVYYMTYVNNGSGTNVIGRSTYEDRNRSNTLRAIAIPNEYWPRFENVSDDLGTCATNPQIPVNIEYLSGSTVPTVTIAVDNVQDGSAKTNVPASQATTLQMSASRWNQLGVGEHTVTITAQANSGGSNVYTVTFEKVYSTIKLESDPVSYDEKPTKCTIIKAEVTGTGATSNWWVTNNGNDQSPVWEQYNGAGHVFANSAKSASTWGVAWKCEIGGANATTRSELLKQVGMAVI